MAEDHRHSRRIAVLIVRDLAAVSQIEEAPADAHSLHPKRGPKVLWGKGQTALIIRGHAHTRHPHFVLLIMNEYSQPGFGKISVHGNGMG
ncbi:MAG: hypothetical protein M3505_07240, partial [Verrucomicrobiota bacterium]|nr:hypothetical protein [Verrucomicrobiota bacterium]